MAVGMQDDLFLKLKPPRSHKPRPTPNQEETNEKVTMNRDRLIEEQHKDVNLQELWREVEEDDNSCYYVERGGGR